MKKTFLAVLCLAPIAAQAASAWPQFRGPNATGVSETAKPPATFGPKENVLWQTEVPMSPSSPVVSGDNIFLTTFADNKLQVRSYSAADGKLRWSKDVPAAKLEEFHNSEGSPSASTPAVSGDSVVCYFGSFGLIAHNAQQGAELWRYEMPVAETPGNFGSGTSPIVHDGKVILNRDVAQGSSIIALDLKSGKKVWETPRHGASTSYGSPVLWQNQIVVAGSLFMRGYNPADGKEAWMLGGLPAYTCTTPAATEDLLYFCGWSPGKSDSPWPTWASMVGKDDKNADGKIAIDEFSWGPTWFTSQDIDHDGFITQKDWSTIEDHMKKGENVLLAVKPGGAGDITETHVAWKFNKGLPYVPSPLAYRGRVYMVKDGGMASCFDAKTGAPIYTQERLGALGNYYASPVAADGRVFFTSVDGKVTVIKAGSDKIETTHQVDFGERIAPTMALVENRIYLRTATKLYAFEAKDKKLAAR
jgi:outer membrane protein assembly factor BamB